MENGNLLSSLIETLELTLKKIKNLRHTIPTITNLTDDIEEVLKLTKARELVPIKIDLQPAGGADWKRLTDLDRKYMINHNED